MLLFSCVMGRKPKSPIKIVYCIVQVTCIRTVSNMTCIDLLLPVYKEPNGKDYRTSGK